VDVESEYTQKYPATGNEPLQVWIYCRLCRCRIQVRTVPRQNLPFRCFCGHAGTFAEFDVFQDENEVRRFAQTFEEIYQTTKRFLREADMPAPPKTAMYGANEAARILAESNETDPDAFRARLGELAQAIGRAHDVIERHEAFVALAEYADEMIGNFPEARAHLVQACRMDVEQASAVAREAVARHKQGKPVKLKFPTFRILADLFEEEGNLAGALEVASRAKAIGLPGHEERISRLRTQVGQR